MSLASLIALGHNVQSDNSQRCYCCCKLALAAPHLDLCCSCVVCGVLADLQYPKKWRGEWDTSSCEGRVVELVLQKHPPASCRNQWLPAEMPAGGGGPGTILKGFSMSSGCVVSSRDCFLNA
jgi:hypothetical protein